MPFLLNPLTNRTFRSLAMVRRLTWTITDEETSLHPYCNPSDAQRSLERFRQTFKLRTASSSTWLSRSRRLLLQSLRLTAELRILKGCAAKRPNPRIALYNTYPSPQDAV
jgi:hypothetical protein